MRRLIVNFMALFVLLAVAAGAVAGQSKEFKKTVEFSPGGELRVSTDCSRVHLTSADRTEVGGYARKFRPGHSHSHFDPRANEASRIDVTGDARALTIRTNFDDVPTRDGRM